MVANLILRVNVVEARGLGREDETNVPSPYANVCCGGIKQRTDTIRKAANPEWLCSFEFNLSKDIITHKKRLSALKKQGLTITVFSKDRFSSIFLGQIGWSLEQLFADQSLLFEENTAKWYPLSQTSRQHRRFLLRKRHEEVDISTSASDTDQAEIRVQYGFVSSSSEEIAEEWRSLLSNGQEKEETSEQPSALQQSSSITSFSSRFRLKKENSTSSIASLSSDEQSPKRRKPKSKFKHKRTQTGGYARFYSDVMGITFLEIESADDLPPEKNVIRTGFDMDPFVIVTYGVSTFRTRAIRHSLKPVWNEKLYFHVKSSEENYKIKFAVYDKDKFTNNDFVASQEISISDIIQMMPTDTDTSAEHTPSEEIEHNMGRHTIPLKLAKPEKWQDDVHPTLTIRAKFVPYTEIRRMFWVALAKTCDDDNSNTMSRLEVQTMLETLCSNISESTLDRFWTENGKEPTEDLTMDELVKSLENFILAADEKSSHVDANTIIEAGSDLPVDPNNNKTVNPYFLPASDNDEDEDQNNIDDASDGNDGDDDISQDDDFINSSEYDDGDDVDLTNSDSTISTSLQSPDEADYEALAEADGIQYINGPLKKLELQNDNDHETHSRRHTPEKVIRLNECPICHKPNLFKRGQMDIVTHVATCAANDWTTVDRFLLSNIGSEAQAQRRWFVKLVNKVGYGSYAAGKNNANIIVKDRLTGQLIDERMSVYIRIGMRLLYKGMKTGVQSKAAQRILENMSIKQGRRFDDPLSKRDIRAFIKFHQLDMSEALEPIENFNTFNEFFYRKLKPGSRPCDSSDDKRVAVSPADCRMMAFDTIDSATSFWIKGFDFTLPKLLDDAEEAKAFENGSLAIFRLAPQDYHRYHSPVDGVITKIHSVKGQYYTVNPMAIRTTLDVYGENKRDIVYMDTEVFGKVAIVCIGAMMVGSIVLTAKEGDYLARADELGYFAFGGSTLVVLFEKNALRFDEDLLENGTNSLETLVRVGNHIGVHP